MIPEIIYISEACGTGKPGCRSRTKVIHGFSQEVPSQASVVICPACRTLAGGIIPGMTWLRSLARHSRHGPADIMRIYTILTMYILSIGICAHDSYVSFSRIECIYVAIIRGYGPNEPIRSFPPGTNTLPGTSSLRVDVMFQRYPLLPPFAGNAIRNSVF